MKIGDVIAWVDEIKPNAFDERAKVEWLGTLDGKVLTEVFLMFPGDLTKPPYKYPEDMETALLAEPPHDDIYSPWLQAQIDMANGEYNKYANTMAMFNACWVNFCRWFADTYNPAQGYNTLLERRMPQNWG